MVKIIIEKGTRFGSLTTCGETESRKNHSGRRVYQKCLCDCGKTCWVPSGNLIHKKRPTLSCGCLQKKVVSKTNSTHGMGGSRFYGIYTNINSRCYNPKVKSYRDYGARGIKCEWNKFEDFYKDMYPSYEEHVKRYGEKETTIERKDINGNYCRENCTRATKKEQQNNQRTNTICIINGEQHNLSERARILGMPKTTFSRHLRQGKIKGEMIKRANYTP